MTDGNARDDAQLVLPQLRYDRPVDVIEWLTRVFGFVEESRMSGPGGELYISVVRGPGGGTVMIAGALRDDDKALLQSRVPDFRDGAPAWPNVSYAITVLVPDVDAHHERARAEGAQILTRPQDQPWGLRDYEALDLEGRWWNFSQRLKEVAPEDWGATSLDRSKL
jgi:uncharacterized glyoxalase superfamily protein PhnB